MTKLLLPILAIVALPALLPNGAHAQAPAGDAYIDEGARELVRLARERRRQLDHRIVEYETIAKERMSVGFRIVARERLLYRRETVSRVKWLRDDTVRIEVLGARDVVPPAVAAAQVPAALAQSLPHLAFDPADAEMLLRIDSRSLRHPFAADGETHYRYASGDTAVIRLPDGRSVRLRELRVTARQRDPQFINASFWLDADTHAVVRAYFTLAREYDAERDSDSGRVPAPLRPARANLGFVAIEYGLWDLQWWLPRVVAAEGEFQLGRTRMPLRYERTYEDFRIVAVDAPLVAVDTLAQPLCRARGVYAVNAGTGGRPRSLPDTVVVSSGEEGCDRHWVVTNAEGVDLVNSPHLPESIFDDGDLLAADELREIRRMADALPQVPWSFELPRLRYGLIDPRFVRYNRVEGISVGVGSTLELPRSRLIGDVRFSVPGNEIGAQLGIEGGVRGWDVRGAGYRRVESMDRWRPPFGLASTLGALVLGTDDHDYYRASGIELATGPGGIGGDWLRVRAYAERQQPLEKATDFSIRRLLNDSWEFPENAAADAADQLGAMVTAHWQRGLNPAGVRFAASLALDGETGDFGFGRGALQASLGVPLPGRFVGGLDASAGTSFGDVTLQRLWRIGGASTVRGYPVSSRVGDAFWHAGAEVATALPLARLALFSDMGWAGERRDLFAASTLDTRSVLWSAGIGASLLDGLVRVDLARPVRGRASWRLHAYFDGIL